MKNQVYNQTYKPNPYGWGTWNNWNNRPRCGIKPQPIKAEKESK